MTICLLAFWLDLAVVFLGQEQPMVSRLAYLFSDLFDLIGSQEHLL
jgi:hypothetical protein